MFSRYFITVALLIAGLMGSGFATAEGSDSSPIAISLFPPLQLPGRDYGIKGLRLSILGVHREVRGLDLAVVGGVTEVTFTGVAISGLFNYNRANTTITGLQVAGLANLNTESSEIYGLQLALFNRAGKVHGLQLGLLNIANELHGIQIGLFNINRKGPFHGSPIINVAF